MKKLSLLIIVMAIFLSGFSHKKNKSKVIYFITWSTCNEGVGNPHPNPLFTDHTKNFKTIKEAQVFFKTELEPNFPQPIVVISGIQTKKIKQ